MDKEDYIKARMCTRKRRYDTEKEAQEAVYEMAARGRVGNLRPYGPCRYCQGWHIGHQQIRHAVSEQTLNAWIRRTQQ